MHSLPTLAILDAEATARPAIRPENQWAADIICGAYPVVRPAHVGRISPVTRPCSACGKPGSRIIASGPDVIAWRQLCATCTGIATRHGWPSLRSLRALVGS